MTFMRVCLLVLVGLMCQGCAFIGVASQAFTPPPTIHPQYKNMAGQNIGVMIWADRGIRIDWPTLQVDLANSVQNKLAAMKEKKKELKDAKFEVQPASIVRYQKDHPELESKQVTEIAPKLGVTRLIYVELEDFATRSDMSLDLFRGQARGNVRVVEVTDGSAKVAFENNDVRATFPPKAPREGIPNAGDARIYAGIVDAMATEIAQLFYTYQVEP